MSLELSIDELARRAGSTVRNVRAYQDKGLVPAPRRRGRSAIYDEAHLARVRLVQQLLARGYSLANIAELLEAWLGGKDLEEVLGLEVALAGPFRTESAEYVTKAELAQLFGGPDLAALEGALALGLVESEGDRFRVPSPRTLRAGAALVAAGIPSAAVLEHARLLRHDIERAAQRLVGMIVDHLFGGRASTKLPHGAEAERLAKLTRELRPLAQVVVDAELARALDGAVVEALAERVDNVTKRKRTRRALARR